MKYENCICVAAQYVAHARGYAYTSTYTKFQVSRQTISINQEWEINYASYFWTLVF